MNLAVLGQVKIENSSLPVAVRVSKTRVLKLPSPKGKHRLEASFTVSSDITSEADDTVSLEKTAEIVNTESQDSCDSLRFQLLQAQEETARLDDEVSIYKRN